MLSYDNDFCLLFTMIFSIIQPHNQMNYFMLYYRQCLTREKQLKKKLKNFLKFSKPTGMEVLFQELTKKMMMHSLYWVSLPSIGQKKSKNCVSKIISMALPRTMTELKIKNGGNLAVI